MSSFRKGWRILLGTFLLVLWVPAIAAALEWPGPIGGRPQLLPDRGSRYVTAPPGAYFYPQKVPAYGERVGVPTFDWGYFGARSHPVVVSHIHYYGDYSQSIWPRGY